MKIGLAGYQGSGKSTLFEWLTSVPSDPALSHTAQTAMATVADPRVEPLCEIYHPKKITQAALELVDTPGLNRAHEGNAARLALIREADCLVLVVAAFDNSDPIADRHSFDEDLMLADMEILSGRIGRIEEAVKKPLPRPEREQLHHEEETLKLVLAAIEAGKPLREAHMTEEQLKVLRAVAQAMAPIEAVKGELLEVGDWAKTQDDLGCENGVNLLVLWAQALRRGIEEATYEIVNYVTKELLDEQAQED